MKLFACPFLEPPFVELSNERERHIRARHPDLLPEHIDELKETIYEPDAVRPDEYNDDKLAFVRWFTRLRGGKFVTVQIHQRKKRSAEALDRNRVPRLDSIVITQ